MYWTPEGLHRLLPEWAEMYNVYLTLLLASWRRVCQWKQIELRNENIYSFLWRRGRSTALRPLLRYSNLHGHQLHRTFSVGGWADYVHWQQVGELNSLCRDWRARPTNLGEQHPQMNESPNGSTSSSRLRTSQQTSVSCWREEKLWTCQRRRMKKITTTIIVLAMEWVRHEQHGQIIKNALRFLNGCCS